MNYIHYMQERGPAYIRLFRNTMKIFSDNDPLRLGGATAFFTTFALPAIIFLILLVLRLFLSPEESNDELFRRITRFVGNDTARHMFNVLRSFENIATNPLLTIGGFLFLLFVATTLFKVIKNSLNDLWDIKVVKKLSVRLVLTTRARELVIILSAAVLLLITLFLEGVQVAAREGLPVSLPNVGPVISDLISQLIALLVVTCWFGVIFCYLPDARVPVRIGFSGALLTSILFNLGRVIMRALLFTSNMDTIFGASAAVVLLLLFVFYSSMIFYFGAAFTKALVIHRNAELKPLPYAAHYKVKASKNE